MTNDLEQKKRKAAGALALAIQVALEAGVLRHANGGIPALEAGAEPDDRIRSRSVCIELKVGASARCQACRRAARPFGPIRESAAGQPVWRKPRQDACVVPQTGLEVA